jgi:hypothetical protein
MCLPSGEYATQFTAAECPLSVHTGSPPPTCCAMCASANPQLSTVTACLSGSQVELRHQLHAQFAGCCTANQEPKVDPSGGKSLLGRAGAASRSRLERTPLPAHRRAPRLPPAGSALRSQANRREHACSFRSDPSQGRSARRGARRRVRVRTRGGTTRLAARQHGAGNHAGARAVHRQRRASRCSRASLKCACAAAQRRGAGRGARAGNAAFAPRPAPPRRAG